MKRVILPLLALLVCSCASVETGQRVEKVATVKENCKELKGKTVTLKVKLLGWNCPQECGPPPFTRSDVCLKDETGCIYAVGLGGFSLWKDLGKEFLIRAKVIWAKDKCGIKVLKKDEVK